MEVMPESADSDQLMPIFGSKNGNDSDWRRTSQDVVGKSRSLLENQDSNQLRWTLHEMYGAVRYENLDTKSNFTAAT